MRFVADEGCDFGELVYANARAASGVIFIRFPGDTRATLPTAVTALVNEKGEQLFGCFVIVQPGRIRIGRNPRN